MSIPLKNAAEIAEMREGGAILSRILGGLTAKVKPGVTTGELDELARRLMKEAGGEPSFLNYKTDPSDPPYPSAFCASIDREVVHAPAEPSRSLVEGNLFKIDIGLRYKGWCTDMAMTVPVGRVSADDEKLMRVTREALLKGVEQCVAGNWVSDVGRAVDRHVRKHGFTTVKDLVGHGVGRAVHEDPRVPNYVDEKLEPVRLAAGMVLAIEPMVNAGEEEVRMLKDGWTIVTSDGSLSAHFEVTVAVTDNGYEILTPLPSLGPSTTIL